MEPPTNQDKTIRMTGRLEPRDAWVAERCSIAKALEVLSARSAFLILREAFYGATRFEQFAKLACVSEPVAAARLRELVEQGLMEREDYKEPGQRTRQRYRLTPKGADLLPALVALMQWGDRWLAKDGGPVTLQHRSCGEQVHAELRCEAGHEVAGNELDLAVPGKPARV